MQNDYISRGDTLSETDKVFRAYEEHGDILRLFSDVRSAVIYAPAADVRPVVRGEWRFEHDPIKDPKKLFIRIVCSKCDLKTGQVSNFCPCCGADMRGGSNDA